MLANEVRSALAGNRASQQRLETYGARAGFEELFRAFVELWGGGQVDESLRFFTGFMLLKRARAAAAEPSLIPADIRAAALDYLLGILAAVGATSLTASQRQLCDIACLLAVGTGNPETCVMLVRHAIGMLKAAPAPAVELLRAMPEAAGLMAETVRSALQALVAPQVLPRLTAILASALQHTEDSQQATLFVPLAAAVLRAVIPWRALGANLAVLAETSFLPQLAAGIEGCYTQILEAATDAVETFAPAEEEQNDISADSASAAKADGRRALRKEALQHLAAAVVARGNAGGLGEQEELCVCRAACAIAVCGGGLGGGGEGNVLATAASSPLITLLLAATARGRRPAAAICLQHWPDVLRIAPRPEILYRALLETLLPLTVLQSEADADDDDVGVFREQLVADCLVLAYDVLRYEYVAVLWDAVLANADAVAWPAVEAAAFCLRCVAPQVSARALLATRPPAAVAAAARAANRIPGGPAISPEEVARDATETEIVLSRCLGALIGGSNSGGTSGGGSASWPSPETLPPALRQPLVAAAACRCLSLYAAWLCKASPKVSPGLMGAVMNYTGWAARVFPPPASEHACQAWRNLLNRDPAAFVPSLPALLTAWEDLHSNFDNGGSSSSGGAASNLGAEERQALAQGLGRVISAGQVSNSFATAGADNYSGAPMPAERLAAPVLRSAAAALDVATSQGGTSSNDSTADGSVAAAAADELSVLAAVLRGVGRPPRAVKGGSSVSSGSSSQQQQPQLPPPHPYEEAIGRLMPRLLAVAALPTGCEAALAEAVCQLLCRAIDLPAPPPLPSDPSAAVNVQVPPLLSASCEVALRLGTAHPVAAFRFVQDFAEDWGAQAERQYLVGTAVSSADRHTLSGAAAVTSSSTGGLPALLLTLVERLAATVLGPDGVPSPEAGAAMLQAMTRLPAGCPVLFIESGLFMPAVAVATAAVSRPELELIAAAGFFLEAVANLPDSLGACCMEASLRPQGAEERWGRIAPRFQAIFVAQHATAAACAAAAAVARGQCPESAVFPLSGLLHTLLQQLPVQAQSAVRDACAADGGGGRGSGGTAGAERQERACSALLALIKHTGEGRMRLDRPSFADFGEDLWAVASGSKSHDVLRNYII